MHFIFKQGSFISGLALPAGIYYFNFSDVHRKVGYIQSSLYYQQRMYDSLDDEQKSKLDIDKADKTHKYNRIDLMKDVSNSLKALTGGKEGGTVILMLFFLTN
jgi:hypothetical protein